jgi:polyphenol oxidase
VNIIPNWPKPENVFAFTTTRDLGNLATHVEDDPNIVRANRARLLTSNALPQEPFWLNQTHSDTVIILNTHTPALNPNADGAYTAQKNIVCAVLTADCLPILLCDKSGREVAALHAGWRGLLANIIARGVERFICPRNEMMAWLGPAIGPKAFEVGPEVYQAFTDAYAEDAGAFTPSEKPEHYMLDIYQLARQYLSRLGVSAVYGGDYCTYTDTEHFYSYRRDGKTGRMASLIWRT